MACKFYSVCLSIRLVSKKKLKYLLRAGIVFDWIWQYNNLLIIQTPVSLSFVAVTGSTYNSVLAKPLPNESHFLLEKTFLTHSYRDKSPLLNTSRHMLQCSATCGLGVRSRSVVCPEGGCASADRPTSESICDMGPCILTTQPSTSVSNNSGSLVTANSPIWFYTEWTQQVT